MESLYLECFTIQYAFFACLCSVHTLHNVHTIAIIYYTCFHIIFCEQVTGDI